MADQKKTSGHESASDDVKAKFKEALERKKSGGKGQAHDAGDPNKVQATHGAESHRREFRRKSG